MISQPLRISPCPIVDLDPNRHLQSVVAGSLNGQTLRILCENHGSAWTKLAFVSLSCSRYTGLGNSFLVHGGASSGKYDERLYRMRLKRIQHATPDFTGSCGPRSRWLFRH